MLFAYQFTSENNFGVLSDSPDSLPRRISKFSNDVLLIEEASFDTYSTKQLVYIFSQFAYNIASLDPSPTYFNAAYSLLEALAHLLEGK